LRALRRWIKTLAQEKAMLAYLFWHSSRAEIPQGEYEAGLAAFARALMGSGCAGVRAAASFRISPVPWLDGRAGYEDWVIVEDSGVLERLNVAAVSGAMTAPHARVAHAMGIGHGGLYYHLAGELPPHEAGAAAWLTRPRGIDFRPDLADIAASAGQAVSVWRRFMVLGPGREFLVLGRTPLALTLPPHWQELSVERSAIGQSL
jgi:hypothetical protein